MEGPQPQYDEDIPLEEKIFLGLVVASGCCMVFGFILSRLIG